MHFKSKKFQHIEIRIEHVNGYISKYVSNGTFGMKVTPYTVFMTTQASHTYKEKTTI